MKSQTQNDQPANKIPKLVVTILQCRRLVTPYLFIRYVLPKWQKQLNGNIEVVLLQHQANVFNRWKKLETFKLPSDRIKLVRQWTEQGRYEGATIIPFDTIHQPYPSIPGFHRMATEALSRKADLHLWLEDDALVYDPHPEKWDALLDGTEVGVWGQYAQINIAHLLTRPSFDRRVVTGLSRYWLWDARIRGIEPWLRSRKRTRRTYLPREYGVRYHIRNYPYCGLRYLVDAVRKIAPSEVSLLDLDYGFGCADLVPVQPYEMPAHRQAMNRRSLSDRWFARYNQWIEPWWEPDHLSDHL